MSFTKGFKKTKDIAKRVAEKSKVKEVVLRPPDVSHEQWYNQINKKGVNK